MLYAIHELPTYKEICDGLKMSLQAVTEADTREDAIAKAEEYYRFQAQDNGEYGDGEKEVILYTIPAIGFAHRETIKLTWFCDEDESRMREELSSPYLTGRI